MTDPRPGTHPGTHPGPRHPMPVETAFETALGERTAAAGTDVPSLEHLYARARTVPDEAAPKNTRPIGRRLLAAAVAAAVVAGVGFTALRVTDPGEPTFAATSPANGTAVGVPVVDARALLVRIAIVAEQTQFTPPRADQYEYSKKVDAITQALTDDPGGPVRLTGQTRIREDWLPQDLSQDALTHQTGQQLNADGTAQPDVSGRVIDPTLRQPDHAPSTYAELSAVPTDDPAALLQILTRFGPTLERVRDQDTAASLAISDAGDLLDSQILPPDLAAAIYRTLADVPGITAEQDVTDLVGRTGIAVAAVDRHGERHEIIFDPTTLKPLGLRSYMATNGLRGKAGQPTGATAFLTQAVVDHAGQVPTS